ncbi:MAG: TolC family protein [Candidatus Omnitrophota bacterium]
MCKKVIKILLSAAIILSLTGLCDGVSFCQEKILYDKKFKLTLDECIHIALQNHLPLEIAKKQLKLANFRVLEAQRKLGPSLTAKAESSDGKVDEKYYTGSKFSIEGKQPIFYGGELIFSVKQAKINLEIVRNDHDRIKNEVILQVKKAYYGLDKTKKALEIQNNLNEKTSKLFNIAKIAYDAGAIAQLEFLKVSSQHNQTSFQKISAIEDVSMSNMLLQQAMNINEEISIVAIPSPKTITLSLSKCYGLAYLNRPELKISQLSLEYYEYEKKIRRARSDWPRVDLLGMYGNMREDFIKDDIDPGTDPRGLGPEYYFGTKVSIPFWGSTADYSYTKESWQPVVRTKHQTESATHLATFSLFNKLDDISSAWEAELEYMRSQDEAEKKKQEVTLEIKETFFKYEKALLLMQLARDKIAYQSKEVEILDIRRELGEARYSDVIEEMIKLAEEEFSYAQAIADYFISIATLNKAIGVDDYFRV